MFAYTKYSIMCLHSCDSEIMWLSVGHHVDGFAHSCKLNSVRTVPQAVGGVDYIYLTHIDDVADHAKFASYFGAKRIIHALEANPSRSPDIDDCEILLQGSGPWEPFEGSKDAKIYFQVYFCETSIHAQVLYQVVCNFAFTPDNINCVGTK